MISQWLRPAVANGENIEARDAMRLCTIFRRYGIQQCISRFMSMPWLIN